MTTTPRRRRRRPGEAPRTWAGDPDMARLVAASRELATLRAEYETREQELLAERDTGMRNLHAKGATFAEMAARAGVSDSLLSRRFKHLAAITRKDLDATP